METQTFPPYRVQKGCLQRAGLGMDELDWDGGAGLRMEELEWGWGELVWAGGARLGMGGAPRVLRHLCWAYQSGVPLLSYF